MKIAITSDHSGITFKKELENYLISKGYSIIDVGPYNTDSVDYPDFAEKVATVILNNDANFGIAICGTGIGISIACNKIKGIRAALVYDVETAQLAKQHNDANIICLGARKTPLSLVYEMIDAYISETFELRHQRRLDKIHKLEN